MQKEELPLGLRFAIIGRGFKTIMDERMRENDVTGVQFGVLCALGRLEDEGAAEIYQRDLENISHVTHPTMTEIMKRLEKKGYIECKKSKLDRRYKCISTTERARMLCRDVDEAENYAVQQLCSGLCETEVETLKGLLEKMIVNVEKMKGENRE